MAKIKVSARPGALSELLKQKGMTQVDAFEKTGVDRKTLSKIDRGEEVKLETLQQVASKLQVTEEHFRHLPAAEVTDEYEVPEPGTIMLRKLDTARLEEFVGEADRLVWHLNAKVRADEARKFLEDFETAVENFQGDLLRFRRGIFASEPLPLHIQLNRLKTADDIAARLERLAEHRLALLGAGHLFWQCSVEQHSFSDDTWQQHSYNSFRYLLLSVEPLGTQSRRALVNIGEPPPFAADNGTTVFINGVKLHRWRAVTGELVIDDG